MFEDHPVEAEWDESHHPHLDWWMNTCKGSWATEDQPKKADERFIRELSKGKADDGLKRTPVKLTNIWKRSSRVRWQMYEK